MFFCEKNSGITIIAETRKDITYVENAILFLRQYDSQWFEKVKKYLKYIIVHPKWSYNNESYSEKGIWMCQRGTVREASDIYFGSLLIHETVHFMSYEKGSENDNFCDEPKAYKTQIQFFKKHKDMRSARYIEKLLKQQFWKKNYIEEKNGKLIFSNTLEKYCKKVFEKRKTWKTKNHKS